MRPFPKGIIDKIDKILGMKGRPHVNLVNGQWVETGGYEWNRYPSEGLLWNGISPELKQAFSVAASTIKITNYDSNNEEIFREHLKQVNASVVEEFDLFQRELHEAKKRYSPPVEVSLPKYSDELDVAMKKISQQASDLCEGKFDIYKYVEHAELLQQKLPEHLKAEIKRLRPQVMEYVSYPLKLEKERELRLAKVRKALNGTAYIAYDDIVVARSKNQYDILRREHTNGANYGLDTKAIIAALKVLEKKYSINIINAGFDSVTFKFSRLPEGFEVQEVGEFLLKLCPDLDELPPQFPQSEITLWWD
jgi:hypothetical protein